MKKYFKFLILILLFAHATAANLETQIRERLMAYNYPQHSAMHEIASEVSKLVTNTQLEQNWGDSFVGIVNGLKYGFSERKATSDDLRHIVPALAAIAIKNPKRDMWHDLYNENIKTPAQQEHILNTYTIITLFQKLNDDGLLSDIGYDQSAYKTTFDAYLNEILNHTFFSKHDVHSFGISKEKISAFINNRIFPLSRYIPITEMRLHDINDFHKAFNPHATYAEELQHSEHHMMDTTMAMAVIHSALADIITDCHNIGIENYEITQDDINHVFLTIANQNPDVLKLWLEYQLTDLPDHETLETLYQREFAKKTSNGELLHLLDTYITAAQDRDVALHQPFILPYDHNALPHGDHELARNIENSALRAKQDREYLESVEEELEAERKKQEEERKAALKRAELERLEEELNSLHKQNSSTVQRGKTEKENEENKVTAYEKRERISDLTTRVNAIRTELGLLQYTPPPPVATERPQAQKLGSIPADRVQQTAPSAPTNDLSEDLINKFVEMVQTGKSNADITKSTGLTMLEIADLKLVINKYKKGNKPVQFTVEVIVDLKNKLKSFRR